MQDPLMQGPLMQDPLMQDPVMQYFSARPFDARSLIQYPMMQDPVMQDSLMHRSVGARPFQESHMMQDSAKQTLWYKASGAQALDSQPHLNVSPLSLALVIFQ